MGGFINKSFNKFLSEYTYNYDKEQLNFKLFSGSMKLENLFLNN